MGKRVEFFVGFFAIALLLTIVFPPTAIHANTLFYASVVVDHNQGLTKGGGPVRWQRSTPTQGLAFETGQNEFNFFSLGFEGWIVVEFDCLVRNGEGNDLSVIEDTWGSYPLEKAEVYASQNGTDWTYLGEADNTNRMGIHTISEFDFGGLMAAKYIKIKDTTDPRVHNNNADGFDLNAVAALQPCGAVEVDIDIKPQSCPNPLNPKSKGVIPVAILGTEDFDVTTIDPSSVRLEGVAPIRWDIEDVATPFGGELCDCTTEGPDGFDDLTLKFDTQEIVAALSDGRDGGQSGLKLVANGRKDEVFKSNKKVVLTLTGTLHDGIEIEGRDCMVIQSTGRPKLNTPIASSYSLYQNHPNPFNPETEISYGIPTEGKVTLEVYNLLGQRVATLVDAYQAAGTYTVQWNAVDVPSGMYFYRITVNDFTVTRSMVLMK